MPTLLSSAKGVLDELESMKADPELAKEAIEIDSNVTRELDHLSQMTRTELSCMPTDQPVEMHFPY